MAARVLPAAWRREAVRLHQHLALLALGAIGAHGLLLAADPWLKAGVTGITVPFALGYRPLWTGLGIVGGYLAAILALSFYVRRRIGARLWRRLHRFTVSSTRSRSRTRSASGTDASIPLVRFAMLASAIPVVVLLGLRVASSRTPARRAPRPEAATRLRTAHAAAGSGAPDLGRKRSSSAAVTLGAGASTR